MSKKKQPRLSDLPAVEGTDRRAKTERREQAAQLMRDQKSRERRRTVILQAGVGAAVVAIVLGTTFALLSRDGDSTSGSASTPPGLTADGAVRFGSDDASVVIQAVEDFQCPACRAFEAASGDLLAEYRDSPDVAVEYRPIAFLDNASSTEYSSRALNASMCVLADAGKDAWMDYHEALYANQPDEGGAGLPDEELSSMAADAGASDAVSSCIEDRPYDDWADSQTESVLADGVQSTPTVFVNGEPLAANDPAAIRAAVTAAGADS